MLMIVIVIESKCPTFHAQFKTARHPRVAQATKDLSFVLWATLISVVRSPRVMRSFTVFAAQDDTRLSDRSDDFQFDSNRRR